MLQLGSIAFAAPWFLVALASLPILWWLLRVTPPTPRLMNFPPVRLLLALKPQEETPARTPIWLILLRLAIALLIILALAQPMLNPIKGLKGTGPVILVIDDGWSSAVDWPARMRIAGSIVDRAEREGRSVRVLTTARARADKVPALSTAMPAAEARRLVNAIKPKPWPVDRPAALVELDNVAIKGSAHVTWVSDGIGDAAVRDLAMRLDGMGNLEVYVQPVDGTAWLIGPPETEGDRLSVPLSRAGGQRTAEQFLRATAEDGRVLARHLVRFEAGATQTKVSLELPGELRNAVTQLRLESQQTAGAVFLIDERWRRRPVGLVSGDASEAAQPLLSSLYYLDRSLKPFAEVRQGTVENLLARELAVLVLADIGRMTKSQTESVATWMVRGGVVLRFAGPKLAQNTDALIPVRLRGGGRALGGAMSWSKPAKLRPFAQKSPFQGLTVPPDVRINQQVLAEPSLDLNDKTWARLSDGTPLITAAKRGQGWLVLVHTTANTDWSNLPLSGLFVDLLRRIVALSQGVVTGQESAVFSPVETLNGFGELGAPPGTATPIAGNAVRDAVAGPGSPPGYYGRQGARRALNLGGSVGSLAPFGSLGPSVTRLGYAIAASVDFMPWLLLVALVLAIVDLAISFVLRGLVPLRGTGRGTGRRAATTATILMLAISVSVLMHQAPAVAQTSAQINPGTAGVTARVPEGPDRAALLATLETTLAYVITGDSGLDAVSRAGLKGLNRVLRRRTAVEPGDPIGVNIEQDELAFYPLLYWSVSAQQRAFGDAVIAKLKAYLRGGGTILFDTRSRGNAVGAPGGGDASGRLRFLLNRLDIPPLIHVPKDHVLTKSFYLLNDFPGRWRGAPVWVERLGGRHNDGVSSVIIGANDWAGAWAIDDFGSPMFAVVPGSKMQREWAYRFGVNWVMYALTGNYKTDQVHVPAIIQRLGQ